MNKHRHHIYALVAIAVAYALLSACHSTHEPIAYKAYSADPDNITESLRPLGGSLNVTTGQWLVLRFAQPHQISEVQITPTGSPATGEFTLSASVEGRMKPIYEGPMPAKPMKVKGGLIAKTLVVEFSGAIGNTVGFRSLTITGSLP